MSKHTPGPWFVREIDLHEGGKGIEIVAGNGEIICNNQTYYPKALDQKNAHLIAAAPELLNAAIKTIKHYEAFFRGLVGFVPLEDLPWVPDMRMAIKEALGEISTKTIGEKT